MLLVLALNPFKGRTINQSFPFWLWSYFWFIQSLTRLKDGEFNLLSILYQHFTFGTNKTLESTTILSHMYFNFVIMYYINLNQTKLHTCTKHVLGWSCCVGLSVQLYFGSNLYGSCINFGAPQKYNWFQLVTMYIFVEVYRSGSPIVLFSVPVHNPLQLWPYFN